MPRTRPPRPPIDALLVSERPLWPPAHGFARHGSEIARSLLAGGWSVRIASLERPDKRPPGPLARRWRAWPDATAQDIATTRSAWQGPLGPVRRKLAGHQGVTPDRVAGLLALVRRYRPRAVVSFGPHGAVLLSCLTKLQDRPVLAWYAADELASFYASCAKRENPLTWPKLARQAAVFAGIEASFGPSLDVVVGVSPTDTHRLGAVTRAGEAVTIRNGVDLKAFRPCRTPIKQPIVGFWGQLDFTPNADALRWFTQQVWPRVRAEAPKSELRILGPGGDKLRKRLAKARGVRWIGYVDDLPAALRELAVAVTPTRCGLGIKNKLLEAAATGLPTLASPPAVRGLRFDPQRSPFTLCRTPTEWTRGLLDAFARPEAARMQGLTARRWAQRRHSWMKAAERLAWAIETAEARLAGRPAPTDPRLRSEPESAPPIPMPASTSTANRHAA
ncbi:MAG: glycosyltransferase family 4 protein [Planctomycetota bacterium]